MRGGVPISENEAVFKTEKAASLVKSVPDAVKWVCTSKARGV